MPAAIRFSEDEIQQIAARYSSGLESCCDIARSFGVAKNTVRAVLIRAGVPLSNRYVLIGRKAAARPSTVKGLKWSAESRLRLSLVMQGHKRGVDRVFPSHVRAKMRASAARRFVDPLELAKLRVAGKKGAAIRSASAAAQRLERILQRRADKEAAKAKKSAMRALAKQNWKPSELSLIRMRQRSRYKHMLIALLRRSRRPKTTKARILLGYTQDQLVSHIERQFQPGMDWKVRESFHIDHVIPIRAFLDRGITDPKIVNALSNLRPMFPKENRLKTDRYDEGRWEEDYDRLRHQVLRILPDGKGYQPATI